MPISVLVVDTNPAFLRFVVQYLEEQHSAEICVAGAAFRKPDALALATLYSPRVALVGVSGPISGALQLIADLRRQLPSLVVVVMSQLGSAGYAQIALEAGAAAFVDKDQLRADLASALLQAAYSATPIQTLS